MLNILTIQISVLSGLFFLFALYLIIRLIRTKPEEAVEVKSKLYEVKKQS